MHFEILVEDQSGKRMLDVLVPKFIGTEHTCVVHAYKGIGHIPKDLRGKADPSKRILLDRLPKLLRGHGKTFAGYGKDYHAAVVVVCDLDDKCLKVSRQELLGVLNACNPKPNTRFCFAVEEGEAWFLGDLNAVRRAYPRARDSVLHSYRNDEVCGTWEKLADAVYPGGAAKLSGKGRQAVGKEKSRWAEAITPHMDVSNSSSPSFCYFRDKLRELARRG
ncbi:MAG: hypothetical protein V2A77_08655 [Pseudomonadota bacterium]